MNNAQGKYVAYSGGKPYVIVNDGKKLIQIPIDPVTQQFACEIQTTFYHQYIAGIIDKRYRRRGLDDRTYFLNVLTARSNSMMQGWMLLGKCILILAPLNLLRDARSLGSQEIISIMIFAALFWFLDRERTKSLKEEKKWWDFEIYHNGLQTVINTIQEKGW